MKKILISTVLIGFLLPIQVKAEGKPYQCLNSKDVLIEREDLYTIICYSYTDINKRKIPNQSIVYYLIKWDDEIRKDNTVGIKYTIFATNPETNQTFIAINEKQDGAGFLLKGRRFDSWGGVPNVPLVNKHKDEITLLINGIEKVLKQQQEPLTRDF